MGPTATFGCSLALCAVLLALFGPTDGALGLGCMLVAGCGGAIVALNHRVVSGVAALALIGVLAVQKSQDLHLAQLVPVIILFSALLRGSVPLLRVPPRYWAAMLPVVVLALILTSGGEAAGYVWLQETVRLAAACVVANASFEITRRLGPGNGIVSTWRYTLRDRAWLNDTARYLLLGQVAGGMAHELSQSMNVIGMANGNLGYILGHAPVPEPHATELAQRVGKIASHSGAAAQMLGQFRWFGQDGGRDGSEMTVGTALERAVMVTRTAARRSGVAIEIRGDALTYPVPLRHGLIEMMAVTALFEVTAMLAARPSDSQPPQAVVLEATRTDTDIEITVVSRSGGPVLELAGDGIEQVTYDMVSQLAASAHAEIRRMGRRAYPVRFRLRLARDIV